uniref:Glutathione peroxidase 2 n=1 Tax=Strigops habroptila TaxID=2489341 RepID=A0A672V4V1_STRHB
MDATADTGTGTSGTSTGGQAAGTRAANTAAPAAMSVPIAKSFYDLSATSLQGEKVDFNVFRGTTVRDYTQLNQLQARYPRRLVVLGFPCNQFGFQVGERHQRGDPQHPEARAAGGRLRAQLHAVPEVPGERDGHSPCLCLPEAPSPYSSRRGIDPHVGAAVPPASHSPLPSGCSQLSAG